MPPATPYKVLSVTLPLGGGWEGVTPEVKGFPYIAVFAAGSLNHILLGLHTQTQGNRQGSWFNVYSNYSIFQQGKSIHILDTLIKIAKYVLCVHFLKCTSALVLF